MRRRADRITNERRAARRPTTGQRTSTPCPSPRGSRCTVRLVRRRCKPQRATAAEHRPGSYRLSTNINPIHGISECVVFLFLEGRHPKLSRLHRCTSHRPLSFFCVSTLAPERASTRCLVIFRQLQRLPLLAFKGLSTCALIAPIQETSQPGPPAEEPHQSIGSSLTFSFRQGSGAAA